MSIVSFKDFGTADFELYTCYLKSKYVEHVRDLLCGGSGRVLDGCGAVEVSSGGGEAFDIGRFVNRLSVFGSDDLQRFGWGASGEASNGDGDDVAREVGCDAGLRRGSYGRSEGVGVHGGGESRGEVSGRLSCEDLSDDFGGVVPKGKNWKKNQRRKASRRGRVNVDTGPDLGSFDSAKSSKINVDTGSWKFERNVGCSPEKTPLRRSLEEKWRVENELKIAKAKKELDLLQSEDREAIKKLRDRKVQGATERTMVQIEKAHASLVQTGNVPGVQPVQQGFCRTVVDGEIVDSVPGLSGGESKGCSISPSSSISEREVRQMKKENEDLKAELSKLKRQQKRTGLAYDVLRGKEYVTVSVVDGSVPESARWALDQVCGKGDWEAVGDLDVDPDTLYLQMEQSW